MSFTRQEIGKSPSLLARKILGGKRGYESKVEQRAQMAVFLVEQYKHTDGSDEPSSSALVAYFSRHSLGKIINL